MNYLDRYKNSNLTIGRNGVVIPTSQRSAEIINYENNLVTYRITTDTIDRSNEVMNARGVVTDNYKKENIVLWNHDKSLPPIATNKSLRINDNSIDAVTLFHPELIEDPFIKTIVNLALARVIKTVSIVTGKQIGRAHV